MTEPYTDFGYRRVARGDKSRLVRGVFDSVAGRYDLMNDLMSGGLHRLWKRFAVARLSLRPGQRVLDLAGGTGDMARLCLPPIQPGGSVVVSDINAAMLRRGRDRSIDLGLVESIDYAQSNAEHLGFANGSFDAVVIAFGLRNVTDKELALREMLRVLRPGGRAVILEFSKLVLPWLQKAYDYYSFKVLPRLGQWVAEDADSYRYLVESIRLHPDQATLAGMMKDAGFHAPEFHNLSAGIVAVHHGVKL
jgi:demethylmenaquinone methyltransferase/2-methoxy-6-polyprenyl-1,4-benzoquinol methylase